MHPNSLGYSLFILILSRPKNNLSTFPATSSGLVLRGNIVLTLFTDKIKQLNKMAGLIYSLKRSGKQSTQAYSCSIIR
jgi:hypothetical protein